MKKRYVVSISGGKDSMDTALLYNPEDEFYEQHNDDKTFYSVNHWAPLMEPPK